jgi:hypothetical protein
MMILKAERERERERERGRGTMEKDLRETLKSPFLWLVLCSFFLVEKNKKEKKSDLFSPSLSFDRIREKEISDIHTEKFHHPPNANESLSGECR